MSRNVLTAALAVGCLFSCSYLYVDEDEKSAATGYPIQISTQLRRDILPFPDTRTIPPDNIPEPLAPDAEDPAPSKGGEVSEWCDYLEYVIYKDDDSDTPLKYHHYERGDDDFGIVYDTLPVGTYQLYFLAHVSPDVSLSGNIFTFPEVSDSFYGNVALEVDDSDVIEDVELSRIVSCVQFVAEDPVPRNMFCFDLAVTPYPVELDIRSGLSPSSGREKLFCHQFTSGEVGRTDTKHSYLTFVPSNHTRQQVTLTGYDKNKAQLCRRIVTDVPPNADRMIQYTGKLYTYPNPDDAFTLFVSEDGAWKDTVHFELPDVPVL